MNNKRLFVLAGTLMLTLVIFGQFEAPQLTGEDFDKLKVRIGADFAMQYQALNHHADSALIPLGTGFNLPTANFIIESTLAPGILVNLTTYLSSRHHNEAWVKGGYLIIDELPFLKSEKINRIMDYLTFRIGDMEINYGDYHFRRSDNGYITKNPFVGNYILDAFSTQIAFEAMFRSNAWFLMGAVSNGTLKPGLTTYSATGGYTAYDTYKELAFYWKAAFDKQFNDDLRLRLALSGYHSPKHHNGTLYNSDRAGSRYYLVMNRVTNSPNDVDITKNHLSGNFGPGTVTKDNSLMANVFAQVKGLEFFGTYEMFKGTLPNGNDSEFNQFAAEALYRFGGKDQFYGGARYNLVNNNLDQSVDRFQVGAGWFLIPEILVKLEYVKQNYNEFLTTYGENAGFDGIMFEAGISF